jgi:hypothetical protein
MTATWDGNKQRMPNKFTLCKDDFPELPNPETTQSELQQQTNASSNTEPTKPEPKKMSEPVYTWTLKNNRTVNQKETTNKSETQYKSNGNNNKLESG